MQHSFQRHILQLGDSDCLYAFAALHWLMVTAQNFYTIKAKKKFYSTKNRKFWHI